MAAQKSLADDKRFDIMCTPSQLFIAGTLVYGKKFRFRGSQQQICSDIIWSSAAIFPLHALPGYGENMLLSNNTGYVKTLFCQKVCFLGFCALCSVSVPHCRVVGSQQCFDGWLGRRFNICSYYSNAHELCDVYAGTFNNMANRKFCDIFNSWGSVGGNPEIGLVVTIYGSC